MAHLDLSGFNTQHAPMEAVAQIMQDWIEGCTTHKETLSLINAVCEEWRA